MTFLWSAQNRLFIDLGSSPGFSGRFPEHFAAQQRKAMTRRALSCRCSRVIRARYWASFPVKFSEQVEDF